MMGFLVGALSMAALSDRLGRRRPLLLGSSAVSAALFLGVPYFPEGALLWSAVFLIGVCFASLQVLLFAIPLELESVSSRQVGSCEGLIISVGFLAGIAASPALGSIIGDFETASRDQFNYIWFLLSTVMIIASFLSSRLSETGWKR